MVVMYVHAKDVFDLTGEHVTSSPCCKPTDKGVRHERRHPTDSHYTKHKLQNEIQVLHTAAETNSTCLCGQWLWENGNKRSRFISKCFCGVHVEKLSSVRLLSYQLRGLVIQVQSSETLFPQARSKPGEPD